MDALREGGLVGDGAMGSLLYERGVYINRSFDQVNLLQPELVYAFTGIISTLVPTCSNRTPMVPIEFGWKNTDWRIRRKKSTFLPWIS